MRRLDDEERIRYRRPWGLMLGAIAFGVYLVFRIVQMVGWVVRAIF